MESLLAYSLIESHRGWENCSIHPVVHDWCAETSSRGRRGLMEAAVTIVGAAAPGPLEPEHWLLEQRLFSHVDRCVQQINDLEGLHGLAEWMVGVRKRTLGEEHFNIVTSVRRLQYFEGHSGNK